MELHLWYLGTLYVNYKLARTEHLKRWHLGLKTIAALLCHLSEAKDVISYSWQMKENTLSGIYVLSYFLPKRVFLLKTIKIDYSKVFGALKNTAKAIAP